MGRHNKETEEKGNDPPTPTKLLLPLTPRTLAVSPIQPSPQPLTPLLPSNLLDTLTNVTNKQFLPLLDISLSSQINPILRVSCPNIRLAAMIEHRVPGMKNCHRIALSATHRPRIGVQTVTDRFQDPGVVVEIEKGSTPRTCSMRKGLTMWFLKSNENLAGLA